MIDANDRLDFYVYLHRRASDGRVFYVGKGTGPRAWVWHNRNPYWCNTKEKHGLEVEIAICGISEQEAFTHEKQMIENLLFEGHPLTNLTAGGEGMSGYQYTDEHRRKLSEALTGRVKSKEEIEKWRKSRAGWRHTDETKARLSQAGSGKKRGPLPDEVKAKISKANTGKKKTEEQKRKASEARKGIPAKPEHVAKRAAALKALGYKHSDETRAKIGAANSLALKGRPMLDHVKLMLIELKTKKEPVLCIETGQVFHTAVAARDWCVSQGYIRATSGRIRQVCNGRGNSCYGHTWRFASPKEECVLS
jgi:hypothetical protein